MVGERRVDRAIMGFVMISVKLTRRRLDVVLLREEVALWHTSILNCVAERGYTQ